MKVELLNWNIDHISDPILIKEKHSPERPQLHRLVKRDKHQKNLGRTNQNQRVIKKEKKTVNAFLWSHLFWNP
jgi:hypothetical protein